MRVEFHRKFTKRYAKAPAFIVSAYLPAADMIAALRRPLMRIPCAPRRVESGRPVGSCPAVSLFNFTRAKCDERLRLFGENPAHPLLDNHALTGDRLGQWSINITGNWRALYEFMDSETIIFVEIGTHPDLYE